jgi:hypothetical protein
MSPILLIALVGGALYVATSTTPKKSTTVISSDGVVIPVPKDRGYTIIIPCKQFDIYNEEASYQYAYHEFAKIVPKLLNWLKNGDAQAIEKAIDEFNLKMYGCAKGGDDSGEMLKNYYPWIYRLLRAGLKAMVDKTPKASRAEAVKQADIRLKAFLEILKAPPLGYDIQGLPTTVEGDFIQ